MSTIVQHLNENERYTRLLQSWARVQKELLFVFWAIMEMALLTPIALSLMPWARYWPAGQVLLWMLLLMLFVFNLIRLLAVFSLNPDRQRTIIAVTLLLTVFFTIRGLVHIPSSLFDMHWLGQFINDVGEPGNFRWMQDASLFTLIVFVWYRGTRLVNRTFDMKQIGLRLRLGGLFIAPLSVWLANRRLLWDVTPLLLLFFLAALTAVSLVRAEQVEQDRSRQSATLDPRWLSLIFMAALLTILTAGLLTAIITGESANAVVGAFAPVVTSVQFLLAIALGTLLFLAIPILQFIDIIILFLSNLLNAFWLWLTKTYTIIEKIISKLAQSEQAPVTETPSGIGEIDPEQIATRVFQVGDLGEVANILTILLMIAVVLLVALLVGGVYKRSQFVDKSGAAILRRSEELEQDDDSLLAKVLRRLGMLRNLKTAVSIRRIYQRMLHAADASGYPRLESETPFEYLKTLAKAWPDYPAETRLITQAYVNVRYGETPETQAELDEIFTAWKRLELSPPDGGDGDSSNLTIQSRQPDKY
ncbi:MAG: DUF4129 domain-containing protein [Chloroflexi bacterium]|nr:MAG: DUF4129 domain-containing protein [Chloroflexota bacterium]